MNPDRYGQHPPVSGGDDVALSQEQSLQRLAETADYVSQRALQLDEQAQEAEQIVLHLGALARQLRTLSSNTTLEATRMRMSGPLSEIARQMRRISQQISESNDQLGLALRSYTVAAGELRQAAGMLQGESRSIIDGPSIEPGTLALPFPVARPLAPRGTPSEVLRLRRPAPEPDLGSDR